MNLNAGTQCSFLLWCGTLPALADISPSSHLCFHSLYRVPGSQQFGPPLAPVVSQPAVLQPYGPPPTSTQVTAQLAGMQISGAVAQAPPPSGLGYGK